MLRPLLVAVLALFASCGMAAAEPEVPVPDGAVGAHINALIDESAALSLPVRVERAFLLTLHAAGDAVRQGDVSNAHTLLRTFVFEVRGVTRAKRLRPEVADALVARAEEAIGALGRER